MLQINSLAHAISKNVLFIKFLPYSIGQVKILRVGQNFDLHLSTHLWYRSTHQVMPKHYDFICNIVCILYSMVSIGIWFTSYLQSLDFCARARARTDFQSRNSKLSSAKNIRDSKKNQKHKILLTFIGQISRVTI